MFYMAWADAHPLEFWMLFVAGVLAVMAIAQAVIGAVSGRSWRGRNLGLRRRRLPMKR